MNSRGSTETQTYSSPRRRPISANFAFLFPSPLVGEGLGAWGTAGAYGKLRAPASASPSPQPSPSGGEGANTRAFRAELALMGEGRGPCPTQLLLPRVVTQAHRIGDRMRLTGEHKAAIHLVLL